MRRWLRAMGLVALVSCADAAHELAPTTTSTTITTTTAAQPTAVAVGLRIDRRTTDAATENFAAVTQSTLIDPRGWLQAGFTFTFGDDSPYAIVLAEAADVDALCLPYDTYGLYSCQNGPVVALNADRWRTATPEWTGTLDEYRRMLVNHEIGHLLGQHHPDVQCPAPGQPAPLMAQQSTELNGCLPNPWPLAWEVACAAQHVEPLAPGYQPDAQSLCGPGG